MIETNEASLTEILVAALTRAWRGIQQRHPDVPDVILTLGSGTLGQRGAVKLGHFAAARWEHDETELAELFIGGEGLRRGAAGVLGTLLHEAAHGAAHTRGVKDTSRGGRYHNTRFRNLGEELGLVLDIDSTRGWSATQLAPDTAEAYADEITVLAEAITTYRHAEYTASTGGETGGDGGGAGGAGRSPSRNLIAASCGCGRKIRAARTTLDEAPILCGGCGQAFEPV